MSKQIRTGIQLNMDRSRNRLNNSRLKKILCAVGVGLILLSVVLIIGWPSARDGIKLLCNRLFELSEAANNYRYWMFEVSPQSDPTTAVILMVIALVGYGSIAAALRSRAMAILPAIALAITEAYFGVVLSPWLNILAFALLAAVLMQGRMNLPRACTYAVSVLVIAFAVKAFLPGIHMPTENASESVRDRLGVVEQKITEEITQTPPETQKTQHENRLDTENVIGENGGGQADHEYRYEQEQEQQIAKPERINYLKIALLFLAIVALLVLPFLPFLLVDSRRKKALERRELFDSEDHGEAIRAMFLHLIAYLESNGIDGGNLPFTAWKKLLGETMPEDYAGKYADAVALWQEAAYSEHTLDLQQREQMYAALEETERILYDRADWKAKFRMKYLECLHA